MTISNRRIIISFILLGAGLVASFCVNVCVGSVGISPWEVVCAIFGGTGQNADIVLQLRLPRAMAAFVLGGALALSGYLLQTFFQNPIAGPFVLGISSGSKLAVALLMIILSGTGLFMSSWLMIASSFVGALVAMFFVLLLSRVVKRMSILIIGGIMVGYICSAVTDMIVTFASDSEIVNLHQWTLGSFSGITWENILVMSIVVLPCFVGAFFMAKPMSAFSMGESYAVSVGVNLRILKVSLVVVSSLLSAVVTAFAGPVSFVGIAAPQIARFMTKTSRPMILIPSVFLLGGVFCEVSDVIARMIFSPTELSISTVTAILGAPVVIAVLINRRRSV